MHMQSLTVRIFLSFWAIIVILIGLAAIAGYAYSERLREAVENLDNDESALAASRALESGGEAGLVDWLRSRSGAAPLTIYIVDQSGRDLLGRDLPRRIAGMLRRFESRRPPWHERRGRPPNLRAPNPLPQLVGPDGAVYSLIVTPKRNPWRAWISERAGPAFFAIALLISAAVSYALAHAIARPVRRFREATVAIADGKLDTRVAASMRNRRDEIGKLAHDLDAMASRLEASAAQQTELTRNISHELRSPLARLKVALELARRQAGDLPEFERIDRESERLDDLIGQILSYSRLHVRTDETPGPLDAAGVLREAVDNANYECRSSGAAGVSVRLSGDEAAPVAGFESSLASAFENILRNAIRHSPENGVVGAHVETDAERVSIRIEDQGSGVPEASLESIFEPFYRAPDATAEGLPGTGLGLAIAERAIAQNGGTIRAQNAAEGGLVIEISLPAAAQSA